MKTKSLILMLLMLNVPATAAYAQQIQVPDGQSQQPASSNFSKQCWEVQHSKIGISFRAIHAVDQSVCWVSGSEGQVLRTIDGGLTWTFVGPAGCEQMDFRDIHAWDEETAIIMSAGDPDRLYKTCDGGKNWVVVFEHTNSAAFLDGFAWDRTGETGWLMGDPVDKCLLIAQSKDRGQSWIPNTAIRNLEIPDGIAGFAASGTNLCTVDSERIVIGLGGGVDQRERRSPTFCVSHDAGKSWHLVNSPMRSGGTAGVFSVTCVDENTGRLVAVGGDFEKPDETTGNIAVSNDFGLTWQRISDDVPAGFRSAVAHYETASSRDDDMERVVLVTVGPNGTDISYDQGSSWRVVSANGFHALSFVPSTSVGWACGSDGRIARWRQP